MTILRAAATADIPAIVDFLHHHMDRRITQDRWRAILDYDWGHEKPSCGWLVEDGSDIAGYLGLIYTQRLIQGQPQSLVNLTSWYLRRPYRDLKTALAMLRAATADPQATYTVFSSRPAVTRLMRRAGFRCLDDTRYIWRQSGTAHTGLTLLTDPAAIRPQLTANDRQLLDDHSPHAAAPFLVQTPGGETCFMLLAIREKGADIAYHEALYLSAPGVFARHAQNIADLILPEDNSEKSLLAIDWRFLAGESVTAQTETIPAPRFFKSERLAPAQIDFLYSEILLLNLKLD